MTGRAHPVPAWGHGPANEEEPPPVLEPQPPQVPEWCHVTERSRRYPPAGMPPPGPANKRGPPARGPTTALAHRRDRRPVPAGESVYTYNRFSPLISGERSHHMPDQSITNDSYDYVHATNAYMSPNYFDDVSYAAY